MALTMSDEHLHRALWVFLYFVCQVHDGTGNSICHLVRVGWVYFFNHSYIPFLLRKSISITSSCGVFPENSEEQFSFTTWKI